MSSAYELRKIEALERIADALEEMVPPPKRLPRSKRPGPVEWPTSSGESTHHIASDPANIVRGDPS